ncbi:MAG: FAD-binding protein, partial [Candidatus Helarchaeota archaeon]
MANKNAIPITPYSSVWDFHGSTITNGGCIVDLRNLKTIEKVRDPFNGMSIDLEPGVTFEQANEILKPKGYRVILPLRLPADASILSTYYGRNPLLEANKYGYHQDWMILTYQMAIAKGKLIGMGSEGLETGGEPGDYPWSPRSDLGRMFLGAIGAYGIITRITAKMKYRPEKYEFIYATSENITDLLPKFRKLTLTTDAGQTALIADAKVLATYLASTKQEYDNFKQNLPTWTGIIALAGNDEYINVEKQDLKDAATEAGIKISEQELLTGITKKLQNEFRTSKNVGTSFDFAPHLRIEFYTTHKRVPKIRSKMDEFFKTQNIDEEHIGFLLNSLEMGRTYFCEYDIYYNLPSDKIDPTALPNIG